MPLDFASSVCLLYTLRAISALNILTFSSFFSDSPPRTYSKMLRLFWILPSSASANKDSTRAQTLSGSYGFAWYVS